MEKGWCSPGTQAACEVRVILTSTPGDRLPVVASKTDIVISVTDVAKAAGKLAISPQAVGARVFPGEAQHRFPIDHSEDCGIVWYRGETLTFRGDKQRRFLEILFSAYWSKSQVLRLATVLEEAGYGGQVNTLKKAFGRGMTNGVSSRSRTETAGSIPDPAPRASMKRPSFGAAFFIFRHLTSLPPSLPPACLHGASQPLGHGDPASVRKNHKEVHMALRHLSQIELAARWNISHRTLERWRWTGEGPKFIKLGWPGHLPARRRRGFRGRANPRLGPRAPPPNVGVRGTNMTISNHITLADIHRMPVGQIAALPADQLAMLKEAADQQLTQAKTVSDWLDGAISLKYAERAAECRS